MTDEQNITKLANDPLTGVNMKDFHKQMQQTYLVLGYMGYVTETIRIMISLLSVAADILIVVIMKRSKKFTSKTDRFILHYAIWHMLYMMTYDLAYDFLGLTGLYEHIPFIIYRILLEIARLCHFLIFSFAVGLGIGWFLNIHNLKLGERFSRFNRNLLYFTYGIGIFPLMIVLISLWFTYKHWTIKSIVTRSFYSIILILIIVLNKLGRTNESLLNKQSYDLTVANIIIFPWLPLYIYDYLLPMTYGHFILHSTVLYTIFLPEWICFSTSIIIVIMLIKLNKYFDMGFWRLFKRRVKDCNADTENLDESEQENSQDGGTIPSDEMYL